MRSLVYSPGMGVMISKADAIVIGSGGLGAATAYYLSEHKRLSVVLTDKLTATMRIAERVLFSPISNLA